jgi:hypothetical protein
MIPIGTGGGAAGSGTLVVACASIGTENMGTLGMTMGTWLVDLVGVASGASIDKGDKENGVGITVGAGLGALTGTWNMNDGASIGRTGGSVSNWGGKARDSPGIVLVLEKRGRASIGAVRGGRNSIGNAEGGAATSILKALLFRWDDEGEFLP